MLGAIIVFGTMGVILIGSLIEYEKDYNKLMKWKKERREKSPVI